MAKISWAIMAKKGLQNNILFAFFFEKNTIGSLAYNTYKLI
jgi:hypothetical protein